MSVKKTLNVFFKEQKHVSLFFRLNLRQDFFSPLGEPEAFAHDTRTF